MVSFKLNVEELIKGTVLALILVAGMALGMILRVSSVNGFVTWFIVGTVNTIAAIIVYLVMKKELSKKEKETAEKPPEKKSKAKDAKKTPADEKKDAAAPTEEKKDEVPAVAFETPADKKAK
jgi:phosphate/sulfate permease